LGKRIGKKIIVFKHPKKTDIGQNTQPKPKLSAFFRFAFFDSNPCIIIQKSGENQQKQKPPVPTGIKIITGQNQQQILSTFSFMEYKPIEYKNYGKKNSKGKRIEKHRLLKQM
jgi:hypothetical protein